MKHPDDFERLVAIVCHSAVRRVSSDSWKPTDQDLALCVQVAVSCTSGTVCGSGCQWLG